MSQKTFSQKVARVFEIVGYLWLLPSLISLIFPFMILFSSIASLRLDVAGLSLIPFAIFGLGMILLGGYARHARGIMDEGNILPLWGGTFFFNLLFFAPVVYVNFDDLTNWSRYTAEALSSPYFLFWLFLIFWWFCAVVLSIAAGASVIKSQKYL